MMLLKPPDITSHPSEKLDQAPECLAYTSTATCQRRPYRSQAAGGLRGGLRVRERLRRRYPLGRVELQDLLQKVEGARCRSRQKRRPRLLLELAQGLNLQSQALCQSRARGHKQTGGLCSQNRSMTSNWRRACVVTWSRAFLFVMNALSSSEGEPIFDRMTCNHKQSLRRGQSSAGVSCAYIP